MQQVGGKDTQQLFVFARIEPKAQPQCAIGIGGSDLVGFNRAELVGVARRANVAQLQGALFVEQYRPATALRDGLGREHAEQGQQCDGESYGDPEPAQGEIPS
ncbi:hypothetical protein D3C80_1817050 [compost metagenome]